MNRTALRVSLALFVLTVTALGPVSTVSAGPPRPAVTFGAVTGPDIFNKYHITGTFGWGKASVYCYFLVVEKQTGRDWSLVEYADPVYFSERLLAYGPATFNMSVDSMVAGSFYRAGITVCLADPWGGHPRWRTYYSPEYQFG